VKINVSQTCPACNGQKLQVHPSWEEFYAEPDSTTQEAYFLELGYFDERPPKLIACRRCRGLGEVEGWVALDVLLPNIVGMVRELLKGQAP
jgi:hypothetical protein